MHRILIIEDDETIRRELCELLKSAGYVPLTLPDSIPVDTKSQIATILDQQPDLLLLDIGLPGPSGKALLRELRAQSNLPVIMVTGNNTASDEVLSMSYGADDFVAKPYNPDVLLLRIAAVLRRLSGSGSKVLSSHNLSIDLARGVIEQQLPAGSVAKPRRALLTKNEMIILRHLLEADEQIVTREALMTDLWDNQEYINDNALTVNISRLRSKLKSLDSSANIETRKGLGYIFS